MCRKSLESTVQFAGVLTLACLLRQCRAFGNVHLFTPGGPSSSSFRRQSTPVSSYGHAVAEVDATTARPRRRSAPSPVLLFSPAPQPPLSGVTDSTHRPRSGCSRSGSSMLYEYDHRRRQRQRRRRVISNGHYADAASPCRYRRLHLPPSSTTLSAVGGGGSGTGGSRGPSTTSPPPPAEEGAEEVEVQAVEGTGAEAASGLEAAGTPGARKAKNKKKDKSVLGKAGDALKATFNTFMAASTVLSLFLAAEALWQLHGTPLTLSNAVPTLTKLIPLTGLGVFGAAQLVGLVARVVRVIVTLPIMVSGTWVILQNAPKLLPHGSDLTGAGSLAALLATPEVLEAAAVLALLGGTAIWALNFATGAVGSLLSGRSESSDDEED